MNFLENSVFHITLRNYFIFGIRTVLLTIKWQMFHCFVSIKLIMKFAILTGIVWLPCRFEIAACASWCEPNLTKAQPATRKWPIRDDERDEARGARNRSADILGADAGRQGWFIEIWHIIDERTVIDKRAGTQGQPGRRWSPWKLARRSSSLPLPEIKEARLRGLQ
jgi:hypothetical protein